MDPAWPEDNSNGCVFCSTKPGPVTDNSYVPGERAGIAYSPEVPVRALRVMLCCVARRVTWALGMAAPLGSLTTPLRAAEPTCAWSNDPEAASNNAKRRTFRRGK